MKRCTKNRVTKYDPVICPAFLVIARHLTQILSSTYGSIYTY